MSQKRVSSKIKQKQQQTKLLEEQTKKMEQKLAALRQQVQQQKKLKQSSNYESTLTKWKKASPTDAPLKDYAKKVLADRKEALNKFGINEKKILGSKSFQPALTKLKAEKKEQQEKDLSKLPKFEVTSIIEKKQERFEPATLPVQSIQNNFFKAKINTKEIIHQKGLQQFLEQNFLQQYLVLLNSNDVNDLEGLYHLSREKMTELGIKPGHQAKIIKRLAQQFSGKGTTKQTESSKNLNQLQKKGQAVSFGYGDGDVNQYNSINSKEEIKKQTENKQIEYTNNSRLNEKKTELSYQEEDEGDQEDEQQNNDQVILTMPQMSEYCLQTNAGEREDLEEGNSQFNCFQCYRKCTTEKYESSDGRQFCSNMCLNKYLQFMQKKCPECEDIFYKFNGYFEDGLWFCSIKCSPNQEKIQEMFMQWGRQGEADSIR